MNKAADKGSFIGIVAIPMLLVVAFGIGAFTWDMKFRDAERARERLRVEIGDLQYQIKQARLIAPDDAPEFYRLQTGMDAKLDEILNLLKKS